MILSSSKSDMDIPKSLRGLKGKKIRFGEVIESADMYGAIKKSLGINK